MTILGQIRNTVVGGGISTIREETAHALAKGHDARTVLEDALIPAMAEVGGLFESGKIFIPEMLLAAHTMKEAMTVITPALTEYETEQTARVAIGTVEGDLHDIGKNLVLMMLEGAGYQVQDLGTDVSREQFVECASQNCQVIGMSALLSTTMKHMEDVIVALEEAGVRERVKVIVGGAPVNAKFAASIGADGYALDATAAVRIVKELLCKPAEARPPMS